MPGTIGVSEARHHGGRDLYPAARRGQRLARGVLAEGAQDAAVVRLLRQQEFAPFPEGVEVRRFQPAFGQRGARAFVQVAQPLGAGAALRERVAGAQAFGQVGEYVVVVAGLAVRRRDAMHGHHQGIGRRRADVFLSSVIVQGSTISAWRAVAVQPISWTTKVSSVRKARASRPRSWWWWKGFPPAQ